MKTIAEIVNLMRSSQSEFGPREHRNLVSYTIKEVVENDCYKVRELDYGGFDGVIDIGANYGIFSAYMRCLFWSEHPIVAYEPFPETYGYLTETCQKYGIEPVACGLGDDCDIYLRPFPSPMCVKTEPEGFHGCSRAYGMCLDSMVGDFLKWHSDANNILVKVDCEGAEWGMQCSPNIRKHVGAFVMEVHPNGEAPLIETFYDKVVSKLPGFSITRAEASDNEHSPIMLTLQRKE